MKLTSTLALAAITALSACFLPSARQLPYEPHPERVKDPMAVLKEAFQSNCPKGVTLELVGQNLRYVCSEDSYGTPEPEEINFAYLSTVRVWVGDWYQVTLVAGSFEGEDHSILRFGTSEEALRVADALIAIRNAVGAEPKTGDGRAE